MSQEQDEKCPSEITSNVEITSKMSKNIVMDNVSKDRGNITYVTIRISEQRLFEECQQAIPDSESPGIPIDIDGNLNDIDEKAQHCPDRLKIVEIGAQGIHLGVRYGFDQKKSSAIAISLADELPDDLIFIIAGFSLVFEIKSYIYSPMRILAIARGKLTYDDMVRYNKWIINMEIIDFETKLKQMANGCIGLDTLKRYFNNHSRREFTELLEGYGIKTGPALRLFMVLSQQRDIKVSYIC